MQQLTQVLGGKTHSIHNSNYSVALNSIGDFIDRVIDTEYELPKSIVKQIAKIEISSENGKKRTLKENTEYVLKDDKINFHEGVLAQGSKIHIHYDK